MVGRSAVARRALALAGALLGAVSSAHADATVTIRVFDAVGLSESTLTRMQAAVEAAFAPAEIAVEWQICPPSSSPCEPDPRTRDIVVRVMPAHEPDAPAACGFAMSSPDRRGFVSLAHDCALRTVEALKRRSLRGELDPITDGEILGYTLAHEIAHVLLPGVPHARHGLFKARLARRDWDRMRDGHLRFGAPELALLRALAAGAH